MKTHVSISAREIKGPLNLSLTINSGQTSQPAWVIDNNYYTEFLLVDNQPFLIKLSQEELTGSVEMEIESNTEFNLKPILKEVRRIFDLDCDLTNFYEFLKEDPKLAPTIDFCKGLRLFKAHNIFECLISSICSANNSIIRWNRSIMAMREKWGDSYRLPSGKFHTFPSPLTILNLPEHEIEEMEICGGDKNIEECIHNLKACGVGYRGKYIKKASSMVNQGLKLGKLGQMGYDNAFETLLEFPGVGPKVADCILLYGYGMGDAFPTDVWIKRIISHLYFDRKDVPVSKIREFGQNQFGEYAGYTQLYLFHYARKSGLLNKLKPVKK
jgi:N-glycosylase/DNA lyase